MRLYYSITFPFKDHYLIIVRYFISLMSLYIWNTHTDTHLILKKMGLNSFNLLWNGLSQECLSQNPLWGRVYSIFIHLIRFFTLINGRMCSQRNCPVCSLKPIICLCRGRLVASNRFLDSGVYNIVRTCLWEAVRVSIR